MPAVKRKYAATNKEFNSIIDAKIESIGHIHDHRAPIRKTIGVKTKMGFVEFLNHLFDLNEDRRYTDAKLKAIIMDEFGHNAKTVTSFADGNQTVSKIRHEFNQAFFQPSIWPPEDPGKVPRLSLRYNEQGKSVNSRCPSQIATNGFLKATLVKFPKVRETYEELMIRLGRNKRNWNNPDATE